MMPSAREILVRSVTGSLLLLACAALGQESPTPLVTDGRPAAPPGALNAGGHQESHQGRAGRRQLSDLTLLNFFTEGWGEAWAHRHRETPDMSLLRVTTNFLEREYRLDY